MRRLIAFTMLTMQALPAWAHGGERHGGTGWTFDPWMVTPITIAGLLYLIGTMRLWRSRMRRPRFTTSNALFWAGLATLVLALLSPVHELGEHLFTVHMIEHELVMAVAAPLLVLARPIGSLLWGLPAGIRRQAALALRNRLLRSIWSILSRPAIATFLHGAAIWAWHIPILFDATVIEIPLHRLQHLSFFLTGVLFWWAVVWRSDRGWAAWHLFLTMLHTTILGALIALAPNVIYVDQTRFASEWGFTALEDQQLAGIIMWVPGGIIYAAAALWFLANWISAASRGGGHGRRSHIT